jgi:large subunit ribosomal protein L3
MANVNALIGRKLGMTQLFAEDGQRVPVTVLEVGPCTVLQKKTVEKEGYNALHLGFLPKKASRVNKPMAGHCAKAGHNGGFAYIKEIRVDNVDEFTEGQVLTLADVDVQQLVDVIGITKGRGFAGTVKRHNFSRGPMGHGSKHHRAVGSSGMSAYPGRVIKGKKMPGRMGGKRKTIKNSLVIDVRPERNLLMIKGGVAGAVNQMVMVKFK